MPWLLEVEKFYAGPRRVIFSVPGSANLHLTPHSPFLNAIENVFSEWKNAVHRGAATKDTELQSLIQISFEAITIEDCAGFFIRMKTYVIRAVNGEASLAYTILMN